MKCYFFTHEDNSQPKSANDENVVDADFEVVNEESETEEEN